MYYRDFYACLCINSITKGKELGPKTSVAQRKRENYTGTQSFLTTISNHLTQKLLDLIGCFKLVVSKLFKHIISIYRRSNFVSHHCGCIPIYRSLSYLFARLYFKKDFICSAFIVQNKTRMTTSIKAKL